MRDSQCELMMLLGFKLHQQPVITAVDFAALLVSSDSVFLLLSIAM